MDIRPSSNPSPIHIERKNAYRWRGGKRTVYDKNGIQVIVQTKSVAERLKESFAFSKKENRVYETVKLQIRDAQNGEIVEKNFTLSKFGMRARTKELESKLDEVLKNINSNEASSNPPIPPAPSTPSPAPQNLTPKPDNPGTPQATPKSPTPTPTNTTPTTTEPTVTPEATISPELQTTMPSPDEAKKLAEDYCNPTSSNKQELEKQLNNMLETLDKTAATNPQEVQKIANAVNNVLRGSIRKLKSSAPQELTNLQATAETLRKKAVNFINADTYIDNINNGTQKFFDGSYALKLQQAATDENFSRHEEALQALMKVASKSCENIQEKGFFNYDKHDENGNMNPLGHLKDANVALQEIFTDPSNTLTQEQSKAFTQLQEAIGNMISNACQEFCNVIDSPSKDAEKFSPRDITNLCLLKRTLPVNASMPEPMQNAFNKATTELCGRIQGKDNPSVADVAMLNSIHDVLNDDSAECQDIEKTFFENLEDITNAYEKYPSGHKDPTAIEAIAQKHANRLALEEATKALEEETYKNLPADPFSLTPGELQDLLDKTSIEDISRYAEAYAIIHKTHGSKNSGPIAVKLAFVAQAVGQKLLKGIDQISNDDVQKLQVIFNAMDKYLKPDNPLRGDIKARLQALETLQELQSTIANPTIDSINKLVQEHKNANDSIIGDNDPFKQAIQNALASNIKKVCPKLQTDITSISKEAVTRLIASYEIFAEEPAMQETIGKFLTTNQELIEEKFINTNALSDDDTSTFYDIVAQHPSTVD